MARGQLRVYLGAAPGVGKTYAMLAEGQRRRSRDTDVVVALLEDHGRRLTAAMAEGLELVPRRSMSYRGAAFTEMDLDAVLARRPQVALVDELAHTNVPGCRNAKRWQDVDELLDARIDVITTLNIQHLESLSDVAKQVTGVEQHETLPDEIARRADQIELVDMTPEALRRRMVHGNVYPPDRIEAALSHYFRPGNLTALRELALLWLADRVEEGLQRYRAEHGIATPWETRERIVVGIAGEKDDEAVIRRAARIAARTPGSDLLAVHVNCDDGLAAGNAATLDAQRALVALLGGSFQQLPGDDVAEALLRFARAENATQMVLGASRRSRLLTLFAGKSTPTRLARRAEHIDVHLVSRNGSSRRKRRSPGSWLRLARAVGGPRVRARRRQRSPGSRPARYAGAATRPPCLRRYARCSAWPRSACWNGGRMTQARAATSWPAQANGRQKVPEPTWNSRSARPSRWPGGDAYLAQTTRGFCPPARSRSSPALPAAAKTSRTPAPPSTRLTSVPAPPCSPPPVSTPANSSPQPRLPWQAWLITEPLPHRTIAPLWSPLRAARWTASAGSSPTSAISAGCTPGRWRPISGQSILTTLSPRPSTTWARVATTSPSARPKACPI